MTQLNFPLRMQGWFNISKSFSVIHHINKVKKKYMIISTSSEAFEKIQHSFITKTLTKIGIEGTS